MTAWEYLIIAMPAFEAPTLTRWRIGRGATLDDLGDQGSRKPSA